jgi:hypothetical protein
MSKKIVKEIFTESADQQIPPTLTIKDLQKISKSVKWAHKRFNIKENKYL